MAESGIIRPQEAEDILDFQDAQAFLTTRLQDSQKTLFRHGKSIERSLRWFEYLGNPQESISTIHLAGTSGKGSTSYFLSSILSEAGRTIGTHVSPHVYDIRERLLLNGEYIAPQEFTRRLKELIPNIAHMEHDPVGRPTYFEVTNALALQLFSDNEVDYAVLETGLGGRYDSTNTIRRSDKVAVITRLGFDHTEILGDTIDQIAWQKGGIIPEGGIVFALQPHEKVAQQVLQDIADERRSQVTFIDPATYISKVRSSIDGTHFHYHSPTFEGAISLSALGEYQLENVTVAIEVAAYIAKRDGWPLTIEQVQRALKKVRVPGRAEIRRYNGRFLLLDSAHNPQKLAAFFSLVETLQLPQKPIIIFAAKKGKDWAASLPLIADAAETIYFTEFFRDQPLNLQQYAVKADEFAAESAIHKLSNTKMGYRYPIDALNDAIATSSPEQPIIVVGSMYMLGELHGQMKQNTQYS